MADVSFDEEQSLPIARPDAPRGLAGAFVKMGLAKTQSGANVAIIIVALFLLGCSAYLLWQSRDPQAPSAPDTLKSLREIGATPAP